MTPEIFAAIESARTVGVHRPTAHEARTQKTFSRQHVLSVLLSVARDLPDEMSIAELREELEGADVS